MKNTRILSLVMALMMVFSMTLCNVAAAEDATTVVRVGIDADVSSISPFGPMDGGRAYVYQAIYEYMAQRVAFGASWDAMDLVCAKSITQVDDVTYDIEMYDYISDSAGNHITAADYVWAAYAMKESGNYPKMFVLDTVEATGDYSVRLKITDNGLGNLEWLLSMVPVISQSAYEASADKMINNPITTAAYQVESFVNGSEVVLVKNENYWQTDESVRYVWSKQNVDRIEMKIIMDSTQMSVALKTNEIDMAELITPAVLGDFYVDGQATEGWIVDAQPATMVHSVVFNCSADSALNNLALRQAIGYAIDSETIMQFATSGHGKVLNAFANNCASDYIDAWDERDYFGQDLDKAKALLAESGFDTSQHLKLLVVHSDEYERVAQVIQAQLLEIGIIVDLNVVDGALQDTEYSISTAWDLGFAARGCDDYCTFPWMLLFNANGFSSGLNINLINDPTLQELYMACSSPETHSEETVAAFEQYLEDQAYGYGLYTGMRYCVANSAVCTALDMREGGEIKIGGCTYVWND